MHSSTNMNKEDNIISMIIDTLWYLDMDDQIEQCIKNVQNETQLPTLSYFAKTIGNGLNEKQTAAYEIICSSFILKATNKYNLLEGEHYGEMQSFLKERFETDSDKGINIKEELENVGGRKGLIMFLSGERGSGKTTTIQAVYLVCKYVCTKKGIQFDNTVVQKTAFSGSAASLFGRVTLHSACNLNMNESKVSYEEEWQSALLFIDEVSFLMDKENRKLDRNLRKMTSKKNKLYGDISIVYIGDFFQILPNGKTALYHNKSLEFRSARK